MSIGVALVTRNRPESLRRTLVSLRAQTAQPAEVVISDDSDDAIAPVIEALAKEFDCRYTRGPRRGLYANRNHAASVCTGTHLRTMDDDHEFPQGHIEECLKAISQDPDSVWIIGEYYPGQTPNGPPPCPGQLTPRGYSATPPDPDRCWAISCGASIYPRLVLEACGGNAEFFKFGPLYLELGSRLWWMGYRIRFLSATHVIHHLDPAARSHMDFETDLAARFFSIHCHARLYQPSIRNAIQSSLESIKLLAIHRRLGWKAYLAAGRAFAAHRTKIQCVGVPPLARNTSCSQVVS